MACIKTCDCEGVGALFGTMTVDKSFLICPSVLPTMRCGGICVGEPCAPLPDTCTPPAICLPAECCDGVGTTDYTATCDGQFFTQGNGAITAHFECDAGFCESLEGCPEREGGDVFRRFKVSITKSGFSDLVEMNLVSIDNMTQVGPSEYEVDDPTQACSVSLELNFDDHDNPGNEGKWTKCCRYDITIISHVESQAENGYLFGEHYLTANAEVASDCCTATDNCEDVDILP